MSFYNVIIWTLDEWNVPYKMLNGIVIDRHPYEYCFYLEAHHITLYVARTGNMIMCKYILPLNAQSQLGEAFIRRGNATVHLAAPGSIDQLRDFIFEAR